MLKWRIIWNVALMWTQPRGFGELLGSNENRFQQPTWGSFNFWKKLLNLKFFGSTSLPPASTWWFDQCIQAFLLSKKCGRLISATSMNNSSEKFLGKLRKEPGAIGWEARMLPLCYAPPLTSSFFTARTEGSNPIIWELLFSLCTP